MEPIDHLERSAIVLAGGNSSRFGNDKGLTVLAEKPLIKYVLDAIEGLVEEKIVVASSESQAKAYSKTLGAKTNVLVDVKNVQTPLVGALTGLEASSANYSLLLPCDVPFVSRDVLALLFDLCIGRAAAIPRWPNSHVEPLQAVYCTKPASEAARKALDEGKFNLQAMIEKLHGTRYISTLVLQQLDPQLETFFNVNTPMDLKRAELTLKRLSTDTTKS